MRSLLYRLQQEGVALRYASSMLRGESLLIHHRTRNAPPSFSHHLCWHRSPGVRPLTGKGAVDFAEFMKMMSKNGTSTAAELKETFALFNKSGR